LIGPDLRRQRHLSMGYFALAGATMALWGTRLPAFQARLHLTAAELSLGLIAAAAAMTVGLNLGGRLGDRIGSHRLQRPAALALALALANLGLSSNTAWFIAACALFGFAHGGLDVSMNTTATACQAGYGRSILQGIHAVYSLGALAGALASAATATLPVAGTCCTAALLLAVAVLLLPALPGVPASAPMAPLGTRKASGRPPAALLALGALAAFSLLGEGAAADWAAVQMHTLAHAAPGTAALAYACYCAATAATRLAADRLTTRIGTQCLVRYGSFTATAALIAALLLPNPAVGLIGWALFGAGLATVVPAAIAAAARLRPGCAGRDIALVTTTGYLGMVLGPAAIGALATVSTLPIALTVPAASALAIAAAAGSVHPTSREFP
jgi:MFS family permease